MKLSACIIAKNEEKNLPRLLSSLKGKFDEIVLIDTGSTDKTIEIAKNYGCKVFEHEWNGFADARNRAVKEASGDWLWHFDADFELEEEEYKKAIVYLKKLPKEVDGIAIGVKNLDQTGKVKGLSSHIFIHRKKDSIKWIGKVHEAPTISFAVGIPVFVKHYGYAEPKIQLKKARRNLDILLSEIESLPKNSFEYLIKLFYVIQSYTVLSYENKEFLEKGREAAEEFILLSKVSKRKLGFFLIYAYNYLLSILQEIGDEIAFEKYLKSALSEDFPIPDFYIFAYRFFIKRKDSKKILTYLSKAALLFDKFEKEPFFANIVFATDKLKEFERIIVEELPNLEVKQNEIKKLENLWKKTKGKYLGLLLAQLSHNEVIARKLVRRYPGELTLLILFRLLEKKGLWEEIKNWSTMYPNYASSLFYKGRALENYGKVDEALKFYIKCLIEFKNASVLPYIISLLKKLGEEEISSKIEQFVSDNSSRNKKFEEVSHGFKN